MELNAHVWGASDAEPVIAIHGVTAHGARFARLADRLADRRVIGVDLRGHGFSTWGPPWGIAQHVADLVETAAAHGVERCAWIGHSFGGRLVAEVARAAPDLVERAVLLDPALHIAPATVDERASAARADASFATPDEAIEARLSDGSLFTTPRAFLEEEAEQHLEQGADGRWRWRARPEAVIVAWSEMSTAAPPWPSCPTLVVIGERSWLPVEVPADERIEEVRVPGGHGVLWDDFDETADAIAGFLAAR